MKWAELVGHKEATRRLVTAGLSPSLAGRLICGKYASAVRFETEKIIRRALNGPNGRFFKS